MSREEKHISYPNSLANLPAVLVWKIAAMVGEIRTDCLKAYLLTKAQVGLPGESTLPMLPTKAPLHRHISTYIKLLDLELQNDQATTDKEIFAAILNLNPQEPIPKYLDEKYLIQLDFLYRLINRLKNRFEKSIKENLYLYGNTAETLRCYLEKGELIERETNEVGPIHKNILYRILYIPYLSRFSYKVDAMTGMRTRTPSSELGLRTISSSGSILYDSFAENLNFLCKKDLYLAEKTMQIKYFKQFINGLEYELPAVPRNLSRTTKIVTANILIYFSVLCILSHEILKTGSQVGQSTIKKYLKNAALIALLILFMIIHNKISPPYPSLAEEIRANQQKEKNRIEAMKKRMLPSDGTPTASPAVTSRNLLSSSSIAPGSAFLPGNLGHSSQSAVVARKNEQVAKSFLADSKRN
jgi:hypothetical protein